MTRLARYAIVLGILSSGAYGMLNVTVSSGSSNISYTGFDWKGDTVCGGDAVQWTPNLGSYFTFDFVGIAVYVVGPCDSDGGVIDFDLDGVTSAFDRYSPGDSVHCDIILFEKTGLANETHTLQATLASTSGSNPQGFAYIELQYIMYTALQPGDVVPSSSSVSSTSASTATSPSSTSMSLTSLNPTATQTQNSSSDLSDEIIGGIVVGAVVAALVAGVVILYVLWRRRRRRRNSAFGKLGSKTDLLDGAAMMEPLMTGARRTRKGSEGDGDGDIIVKGDDSEPGTPTEVGALVHIVEPYALPPGGGPTPTPPSIDGHTISQANQPAAQQAYPPHPKLAGMAPLDMPPSRPQSWVTVSSSPEVESSTGHLRPPSSTQTSPSHVTSIADTDVDRIAVRVASMINQRQPAWDSPPPGIDLTGGGEFIPPPSYDPAGKRAP